MDQMSTLHCAGSTAGLDDGGRLEAAASAAEVYATVLADDPQPISLSKASHAVTRVLWQQRFFTQALGAESPALP